LDRDVERLSVKNKTTDLSDSRLDIDDWRRRIDAIDDKLVELLNERANCSIEIGRIKMSRHIPIYDPKREDRILDRMSERSPGPLTGEAVRRLFERIIDESRGIERVVSAKESSDKE
jgi:chorismate mutase